MPEIAGRVIAYHGTGKKSREEAIKFVSFKLGDTADFAEEVWSKVSIPGDRFCLIILGVSPDFDLKTPVKRGSALDEGVRVPAVITESEDQGFLSLMSSSSYAEFMAEEGWVD